MVLNMTTLPSNSTRSEDLPQGFTYIRLVYCIVMFLISTFGIWANAFCFYKMFGRERYRTIFHLLNRTRMISNCIILIVFLIWVIPSTLIGDTYLPHIFNQFFGQLAGWGAYWMGPATQTFISISRFSAAYFPFFYRQMEGKKSASVLIITCVIYCSVLFGMGMRDGCSFEYDPSLISFLPVGDCALGFNTFINVAFTGFFILTTALNFVTAIRILHVIRLVRTSNDHQAIERERRNWKLLGQNTIENFLYLFDVYIINVQVPWYNQEWYQFVINTATWQAHVMVDGLIVLAYNKNLLKGNSSPNGTWARQSSTHTRMTQGSNR